MSALIYIIRKSFKNGFKEVLKKPSKLIMYILIFVIIFAMVYESIFSPYSGAYLPFFWLTGALFLLITLFLCYSVSAATSEGRAIFDMNDVNLLFVSPVNPRKILLYGIIKMIRMAFLAGFFILFQSSTLASFGIGFGGVLLVLMGFMLSMALFSILSLMIYSLTNGRTRRKRIAKLLTALLFLPLVLYAVFCFSQTQDVMALVETLVNSPFLTFIPVAGWTAAGATALLTGAVGTGAIYFGANLLLGAALVVYIMLSNPDYYEDVLVATETAYERKRAMADGNMNAAAAIGAGKATRIAKTGIPYFGAAALFGKHMREVFRKSRLGFISLTSVIIMVCAVTAAVLLGDITMVMMILMWMQIMLIGTSQGLRELYMHYIYMIPETSFKKIIWNNMEIVIKVLTESVLIFGVSGMILRLNILDILTYILVYALFSFVLTGINYLFMRFTGADISAGMLIMIYYIATMLIMAPGVILAIVLAGLWGQSAALVALAAWELAAGLVCFALSSGVLHNCDMPVVKKVN